MTIITPQLNNTPQRLIKRALFEARKLEEGQDPDSEQVVIGMERLNDMVNVWQTQGLKLWLEQDVALTLVANQSLYPQTQILNGFTTKPTRVKEAYFEFGNLSNQMQTDSMIDITTDSGLNLLTSGGPTTPGSMYPLIPLARSDWDMLGTRNSPGTVTSYYTDKQAKVLNVNLWQAPSPAFAVLGQVHLIIQQQQPNVVQVNDQMVFPQEWFLALLWGLADESSSGQPQAVQDRCQQRAMRYFDMLNDWDVEDAPTSFAPDTRFVEFSRFS